MADLGSVKKASKHDEQSQKSNNKENEDEKKDKASVGKDEE